MTIEVTSIYNGMAGVRDYLIEKAKKLRENLIIQVGKEKMTILNKDIDLRCLELKELRKEQTSRFNGKKYYLVYLMWRPDDVLSLKSLNTGDLALKTSIESFNPQKSLF